MNKCVVEPCRQLHRCIGINQKAPDFCTNAYYCGREIDVCLQDYIGKWLLIFFYSGDFTFV